MIADFPGLLVATEFPPNASGGGPAVVRQMLKGWPVEKLFWWSCLPETDQRFGQRTAAHAVARIPQKLYPQRRARLQKSWLLEHFWTPWAARHFRKTLIAFKPDAIWVIPHGWSIPPLARCLPKSRAPFHVTMQDFMDIHVYAARYGVERSRRMAAMQYQLYARATSRDATSHPMIDDLRQQTGAEAAQMLHAGIETEDLESLKTTASQPADKIRIAHAGSIQVDDVFPLFASALAKIRGQLPLPVSLEFFGNHSLRGHAWFDAAWMNEHGNLPTAQLTEELKKCTWGFSPMALTDDDPHYNRLSFPTKFISYLAAGLPVITLGHPESSVMKMAARYDVGFSTCAADVETLAAQLQRVLAATSPRERYGGEIVRCARAEFDAAKIRRTLQECLMRVAAKPHEITEQTSG